MVQWAFEILGIEATRDKSQIKKAYALLVRQYHPEEHPEEWARIHEAYQAAMEYAEISGDGLLEISEIHVSEIKIPDIQLSQTTGFENAAGKNSETEVKEDASYGELLQGVQSYWTKEKEEHERQLNQRLAKLAALKRKRAVKEWRYFFKEEFQMDEGVSELLAIQRTVKGHKLPEQVLRVILTEMENCEESFASREEYPCMRLAEGIADYCRERITEAGKAQKKGSSPRRYLPIVCVVFSVLIFMILTGSQDGQEEEDTLSIEKFVAANLKEKYDTMDHNRETLSVEKAELSDANGDELDYYKIYMDYSWEPSGCVIPKQENEDTTRYMIFDNLQSEEIREAFEERMNERLRCEEGRLYWDSGMYHVFDGVEDGFFQTRYEGDFDAFLQQETKVRNNVPESVTAYLEGNSKAVNGVCEYYFPGPSLQIEEGKFEGEFYTRIVKASAELERCAEEYQVQIKGIAVPDYLFEETIGQAESGGNEIRELRDDAYRYGYVFGRFPAR